MPAHLLNRLRARYAPKTSGPSRREMLKLTLAGTAGLLLSDRLSAQGAARRGSRVLIVGAGFAGLAAAHELTAAGYDVHVIEARNRVGGRVLSFHDFGNGATVEGGAELIGSNHPAWVAYADKFKLSFLDVPEDEDHESPLVLGGKRLSVDEGDALWEEMEKAYAELNRMAASVDASEPWKSPNAAALDRTTVAAWIDGTPYSPLCRRMLHAEFSADNGAETAWQSQLGNLTQVKGGGLEKYWTDSEVYRCAGGNQQLATKLAASLKTGAVRLRTAVKQLRITATGVSATLSDGSTLDGDDVILTVPPSVWSRIAIDPALPPDLRPQMGTNVKFLMEVKSRFWERAGMTADSFADGPAQLTWEATANQKSGGVVMTAFSGADGANICRDFPRADRANSYLRHLEKAYGDIAKEFVKYRFMDWPGDVWTQGGYSFPAPGQVTTMGPVLRAGLGRLHFAGEHTNYAFVGYMEGALGSGITAAKALAVRDGVVAAR